MPLRLRFPFLHRRDLLKNPPKPLRSHSLPLTSPIFTVFGSNTAVGKTLVSTGLASSVLSNPNSSFLYLKPVQTGYPVDSDSRFVFTKTLSLFRQRFDVGPTASTSFTPRLAASDRAVFSSPAAAAADVAGSGGCLKNTNEGEVYIGGEDKANNPFRRLVCVGLYNWNSAVSPHLAVEKEGMEVGDVELRDLVERCLKEPLDPEDDDGDEGTWRVVETAGGVSSPGPSGTLQCDLYR